MKFVSLLAFAVSFSSVAFAQKSPIKFGDVPIEDLKMTYYAKDSSAAAVVLVDYGEAYLSITSQTAQLTFERHVRIKILRKEGLKWGDVAILLRQAGSREERVSNLKATTYNLTDGKVAESKLNKDGIFKEKFNRSFIQQKFTMPDVKEGSVIEYSYKVNSDFYTYFPNWQFQRTIPVVWSEYWAMIPDFFQYEKYMQGYLQVAISETKPMTVGGVAVKAHHWAVKDAPAFKEEPFMTSDEDFISRINFALAYINFPGEPTQEIMGSWAKLNKELTEDDGFGRVIEKSGFLKDIVASATVGLTDPIQKIEAIHRYVKENVEWDGTEDYYPGDLKKILEKKKGTSGDINILLASMLDKAGIPVDMVLLSTRSHGFIRQAYPMARQFNYIICAARIQDKILLLDATEKHLPYTIIPERCLNGQGLVISKTNHGWINIDTKAKAKSVVSADLKVSADAEINGTINISDDGYNALDTRKDYHAKGEKDFIKDFLDEKRWTSTKSEFMNTTDLSKPISQTHGISIQDHASSAGNVIYLNPYVAYQLKENPFKQDIRTYPIDYGAPSEIVYTCKISIPEGYSIDEMPQSKVLALPQNGGRFFYNIAQTNGTITLTSIFTVNRTLFAQTDYPVLREFYNQVVAKQAEQIVLKKN
ncbi:MAG TPA: DUF3857 domain-containing protein [Cyclobacteriaceae bacterium]|nr:DUF3857 domain-containing protein [Cyclobacteriaceae bacterium]